MKLTKIIVATLTLVLAAHTALADTPCSSKPFLATGTTSRAHYAITAFGCSETSTTCGERGRELIDDCEYRGEDGGSIYNSCECQGMREYKTCMQDAGCYWYSEYIRVQNDHPYCFIQ